MPTPELTDWAETLLYEAGRSMSEFRKDPTQTLHLADAQAAVDAWNVCLTVVKERFDAGRS